MSGVRRRGDTRYLPEAVRQNDGEQQGLLVFGYQCKVFRDDEKAMFIESKKHLIPWMGDSTLMIDRHDGRGHLFDLRPFDADLNKGKYAELSEEEKRVEALIDEERYLELHTDVAERAMYEEEELKRLNEEVGGSYGAVNFNYDEPLQEATDSTEKDPEDKELDSDSEEPFEVPEALKVPYGMEVPTTLKQNAIIEKTGQFVSKQGVQMEIVIKTKQQNNPQFEFLNFSHTLNPYYKHVVRMIKSGLYKPQNELKKKRTSSSSDDGKYLHPSLSNRSSEALEHVDSKKFLESIKAKLPSGQITNTLYSKLVSNLSKHTGRDSPVPGTLQNQQRVNNEDGTTPGSLPPPPQPPQTLGNLRDNDTHSSGYTSNVQDDMYGSTYPGVPPPPGMEPVTLPAAATQPPPPGTQPPPPGTGPPDPLPFVEESSTAKSHALHGTPAQDTYYSSYEYDNHDGRAAQYLSDYSQPENPQPHSQEVKNSQLQPVYGSKPETQALVPEETRVEGPQIIPPPPDILPVIDKMASYVAKNGPAFEYVVKNKADGRFDFVHSWHQHNPYYEYKKKVYSEENDAEKREKEAEDQSVEQDEEDSTVLSSQSKAVTFTMKTKKQENPALKMRTALLYESSDEEDDGETRESKGKVETNDSVQSSSVQTGQQSPVPSNVYEKQCVDDKSAEDKLKDKLAIAARDKLAQTNKEKLVQAERKRKAAMFVAMLKSNKQEQQIQEQTAVQRQQAVMQAAGDDTAVTVQPALHGNLPLGVASLALLSSSTTPATSRSNSPGVSAVKDSKSSTPVRSVRSISPTEKFYRKKKSRSKSRSPKRKRSRSRDRRRSKSKSPSAKISRRHKSRSRSKSPRRRRRSKSRSRSKSPRRRRRSKSPSTYHRKSPSRRKRTRSRSRTPIKSKKKKSKRSRSRSRSRRSSSKSKSSKHKSPSKKKSKKKKKGKSRSRSKSPPLKCAKKEDVRAATGENSEDAIEIKSESGDDSSAVKDDVSIKPVKLPACEAQGVETGNATMECSDNDSDPEMVSAADPLRTRSKPSVDMFESDTQDTNGAQIDQTNGEEISSRSPVTLSDLQDSNSGTASPGRTLSSKKNVSKEMLLKVRAILKASRSSQDDS